MSTEPTRLFLTGASGYVGRRLVESLLARADVEITALVRDSSASPSLQHPRLRWVPGDLVQAGPWAQALANQDRVVHLAARTGKARSKDFQRTNVEGTRRLLDAMPAASDILFVSSIAARFADLEHYPYGHSKAQAEALVQASGRRSLIVRPTLVAGPAAPAFAGLVKLARMPVCPLFAGGKARLQPIHVADLAEWMTDLGLRADWPSSIVEMGGPEVITAKDLLLRLRKERLGRSPRGLSFPLRPLRFALRLVEGPLWPVLPLTSGQLASFAEDGTAEASDDWQRRRATMKSLEEMVADDG